MRSTVRAFLVLALVLGARVASADTADQFVQARQTDIHRLLQQQPSPQRDAQITTAIDRMIDYRELTRRTLRGHWSALNPTEQNEITSLLTRLVRKTYTNDLQRSLQYKVTYGGAQPRGSDVMVRTQAQSVTNPRDPAHQVDYVLEGSANGPFQIVDIVIENSSLTTNYSREFDRILTTPGQGYSALVAKIKAKI